MDDLISSQSTCTPNPTPRLGFSDGSTAMPGIGFGTGFRSSFRGKPLEEAVHTFLTNGGRHIDTLEILGNLKEIGRGVCTSGVQRESIFLTATINNAGPKFPWTSEAVQQSIELHLRQLEVYYLDVALLYVPFSWRQLSHGKKQGRLATMQQIASAYQGLVTARASGKVRHIGVSNFARSHVEMLVNGTGMWPEVASVEFHPWVPRVVREHTRWLQDNGVVVLGHSPLGGCNHWDHWITTPWIKEESPVVLRMAAAHNASYSQALLRWGCDQGVAVTPGSNSVPHIIENLRLEGIKRFSSREIEEIASSPKPRGFRCGACIGYGFRYEDGRSTMVKKGGFIDFTAEHVIS